MIGSITGTVKHLSAPFVIIDCNGVGYEIETPLSTFCNLKAGQTTTLWTHFVVREDAQLLYGFDEQSDKKFFRLLLKVNGVGPKLALAILSGMSSDMLVQCIDMQDISTLTKIPGVGKKTAERLVIELRDRLQTLGETTASPTGKTTLLQMTVAASPIAEAEAALVSLGYKPLEAQKAVAALKADHQDTANLIRAALKGMMQK